MRDRTGGVRSTSAAALIALLAACGSSAQPPARKANETAAAKPLVASTPEPPPNPFAGPDSARVRAGVDSVFARFERPGSPGCVVAVMRAGDIVYGRGYGLADIERGTPLTLQSAFDGASMAKQFNDFALLLLAKEGKLSLDDPVHEHLPELPDYGAPVTIRHLVHHTSGLRDYDVEWMTGRRGMDPSTIPSLSFAPGTRHVYDDTGYLLIDRIIERVSGQGAADFVRERIFDPLGMTGAGVRPGDFARDRRVRGYNPRDDGTLELSMSPLRNSFVVTPADLAKWDRNFYDARLGGPDLVRQMMEEGRLNDGETIPYAMGLHTEPYRGLRRLWHGGLAGGYRSQFMRYPDQRTSVLVQCNVRQLAEPNGLAERVTDVVLAGAIAEAEARMEKPASGPLPGAAEMERLAGFYLNRGQQAFRPVRFHQGRLEMRQWITWHPLRPLGGGRYRVEGQPLTFVFRPRPDGAAGALEEHWDGRRTPVSLQAVPDVRPTASELDAYTGRYTSRELGTTWTLTREGSRLRVVRAGRLMATVHPAGPEAFTDGEYTLLLFRRDAAGRVTGLTAATPRVHNLEFERRAR